MATKKIKRKTLRERQIYNEAIRDAMKELWLYDGVITDEVMREYTCRSIQMKLSYKNPEPKELVLIN